jgi:VanZ family protein
MKFSTSWIEKKAGIFFIIWFTIILLLSLLPSNSFPEVDVPNSDKLVHTAMYFPMAYLFYLVLKHQNFISFFKNYLWLFAVIFTILYGGLLELAQTYLTTSRCGSWYDFIANSLGAFMAWLLFGIILKPKKSD